MANRTNIAWCKNPDGSRGFVWNPTVGCSPTPGHPGCDNCYARALHNMRHKAFLAGRNLPPCYAQPFGVVRCLEQRLAIPLRHKKASTFFVNSVADLFHPDVPGNFIDRVFATMAMCPQHRFVVLTKRPGRMRDYLAGPSRQGIRHAFVEAAGRMLVREKPGGHEIAPPPWSDPRGPVMLTWPQPHITLGVSVSDQATAEAMIPRLLECHAATRIVSIEPMLGEIDLRKIGRQVDGYQSFGNFWDLNCENSCEWRGFENELTDDGCCPVCKTYGSLVERDEDDAGIDGIIIGCESGNNRRPCEMKWVRTLVEQAQNAAVAVFVKQLDLDGRVSHDPREWPEDLRLQQSEQWGGQLTQPRDLTDGLP